MSRHRNKHCEYDDDEYDDYNDDYDGYVKPVAIIQKSKPKKKKITVPLNTSGSASLSTQSNVTVVKEIVSSKKVPSAPAVASDIAMKGHHTFDTLSDDDETAQNIKTIAIGALKSDGEPEKACLSIIIAGHVDAGKSTLVGNMLFQAGQVSSRIIELHQKEAESSGKSSFHFAWVTDESQAERERGVTISSATK